MARKVIEQHISAAETLVLREAEESERELLRGGRGPFIAVGGDDLESNRAMPAAGQSRTTHRGEPKI
jgi:hypothetical protein